MKNSINKILAFVAFFAAALFSGVVAFAQNLATGTYEETNGIAYAKRVTINDDGTYTIDLETFVTGEVTQTFESTPADVVLVLDVSGSMSDPIKSYTYYTATRTNITGGNNNWPNNNIKTTNYYYKYTDDEYYPVFIGRGGTQGNRRYFLFFSVNGTRYHINSNGDVVTEEPSNITSSNTNLWPSNVTLYTRTSSNTSTTKIQALKTAVGAFINQINENDLVDPQTNEGRTERLGNRIAIIAFSGANYAGQSNHNNSIKLNTGWIELGENKDINDDTGYQSLKQQLNGLNTGGGTHVEYGMQDALALLGNQNSSADIRTVVLFTDGIPGTGDWNDNESTTSADNAINYSRQINAIAWETSSGEDGHPNIFSVGLFDTPPTQAYTDNTFKYMNYVSSNYPNASNMNTPGGTQQSSNFYMDASGGSAEDLKNIFVAIAHAAGGSGNTEVTGGATLTVDVVSSSFSVPKGFEENPGGAITVKVAPCIGMTTIDGKVYLTFGDEDAPTVYGLPAITPSISEDDNKVSTKGFDYSANWCGPDPTNIDPQGIQPGYHGFKQIISFTITLNEDAIGGPAVETNDSDSGIYLPGATEPLVKFNKPDVEVPVSIWIQKTGLISKTADPTNPLAQGHEDTAVFTLRRTKYLGPYQTDAQGKPISDGNGGYLRINYIYDKANPVKITYNGTENYELKWETFTKVAVNMKDKIVMTDGTVYDGAVMISGLNSDYIYRIEEDAWAHLGYSFDPNATAHYTMEWDATAGEYKSLSNPFIFDNTSRNNVYAEDVIKNVFSVGTNPASGGSGSE